MRELALIEIIVEVSNALIQINQVTANVKNDKLEWFSFFFFFK